MPKSSPVPKFSKKTLEFIQKASRQKRPDWLERHREEYESLVVAPLQHLARELKVRLATHAPGYHFPQKGLGRLKRSANRAEEYGAPFKDWLSYSAARPRTSRFDHNPNLFFMIYPEDGEGDEVLIAGGLYMPSSRQLRAIRETLARDASAFDELFATKAFRQVFPGGFSTDRKATRPPRGFDPKHPRIEWLKLQAYFVWRSFKPREYASPDFPALVAHHFEQVLKLNRLLEQALEGRLPVRESPKARRPKSLESRLAEVEAPTRAMDF